MFANLTCTILVLNISNGKILEEVTLDSSLECSIVNSEYVCETSMGDKFTTQPYTSNQHTIIKTDDIFFAIGEKSVEGFLDRGLGLEVSCQGTRLRATTKKEIAHE